MINFLESWEKYLLARLEQVKQVEDIGYLYEEFVSQDEAIRKAGGVYYTPQYIVNEIVKHINNGRKVHYSLTLQIMRNINIKSCSFV
jgi:hypothetical protein